MKRYEYRARDAAGKKVRGDVIALDFDEATGLLQEAGVYITSMQPESAGRRRVLRSAWVCMPSAERHALLESWAALVRSGFPIQSALTQLRKTTRRPAVKRALLEMQQCIDRGATLAQAVRASRLLPPSWVSLVELGERRGDFFTPLERMIQHSRGMRRIKEELSSMLLMPCVVLVLAIVWVWVYLENVVPSVLAFVAELGGSVPAANALWMHSGGILACILGFLLALLLMTFITLRSSRADQTMGFIQIRIPHGVPVLGPLVVKMHVITVCSELRLQLDAGIPIANAVWALSQSVPHPVVRRELIQAYRNLREGLPVPEALEALSTIPPMGRALISVGDSCGRLPEMLGLLVRETTLDLIEAVRRLTILLRNGLVLATGVLVGLLAVSAFILLHEQFEILAETAGEGSLLRQIESYTLRPLGDYLQIGSLFR